MCRNKANLMLDDPPLIMRMNGLGFCRFMLSAISTEVYSSHAPAASIHSRAKECIDA